MYRHTFPVHTLIPVYLAFAFGDSHVACWVRESLNRSCIDCSIRRTSISGHCFWAQASSAEGTLSSDKLTVASRRPTQKAWQSGMNPLTQRSTTPGHQNGNTVPNKGNSARPILSQETGMPDKHAHDRLISLYANAIVSRKSIQSKPSHLSNCLGPASHCYSEERRRV